MYNYEQSKTLHGPAGTTTHPLSCFVKLQVNHISLQIIQRYLQKHTTGIFRLWDKVRYVEYLVPITKPGQNITIFSFLNKSIIMYGCVSDDLIRQQQQVLKIEKVQYRGDPNTQHLNNGLIQLPDFS